MYRLLSTYQESEFWIISRRITEPEWTPMYLFTLKPRSLNEFNCQVDWINRSDCSWYKNNTFMTRSTTQGKVALCNDHLTIWDEQKPIKSVTPRSEYLKTLNDLFDVQLPENTALDALLAPDNYKGSDYGLLTRPFHSVDYPK